tara:strand:- start:1025 stop:1204 length:180 start_codon:yes stop_codon:yes gene_type:complete
MVITKNIIVSVMPNFQNVAEAEIKEQFPVQKISVGSGWRRYKSLKEAKKDKKIIITLKA